MAVCLRPDQRGKTRGRIKMRQTQPIDGSAIGNQGRRVAVPNHRVVFNGKGQKRLRLRRPAKEPCSGESYPNLSGFLPEAGATAPFSWDHTARCNTPKPDFEVTHEVRSAFFRCVSPLQSERSPRHVPLPYAAPVTE